MSNQTLYTKIAPAKSVSWFLSCRHKQKVYLGSYLVGTSSFIILSLKILFHFKISYRQDSLAKFQKVKLSKMEPFYCDTIV